MAISSVSNDTNTLLQTLQANRAAAAAATGKTESSAESASSSTAALYDTVDISEEGSAFADAQASNSSSSSSSVRAENAALLNSLNTADDSGLSFVQQQEAALQAGVSAADLLGGSDSSDSSSLFSDLTDLLSSYTQANANNTVLRGAGASALGPNSTDSAKSAEDSDSSEKTNTDLSDYTVEELRTMLSKGEITTAEYLSELSSRQKTEDDAESAQKQTNAAAALGAVSE